MKPKTPFIYLFVLCIAMMFDSLGIIKLTVFAALLHEIGHIVAYYIVFRKPPKIEISVCGFAMKLPLCNSQSEIFIACAGPLFNFLSTMVAFMVISTTRFTGIWFAFGVVNAVLGILNILPLSFLDGGKILKCIIPLKHQYTFEYISNALNVFFVIIFVLYIIFVKASYLNKIAVLCFICYFFIKTFKEKLQ